MCEDIKPLMKHELTSLLRNLTSAILVYLVHVWPFRVLEVLSGIAEGREQIDSKRMSSIIKRKIKKVLNQVRKIGPLTYIYVINPQHPL